MAAPVFDAVIHPYRSLGREGFRLLLIAIVAVNAIGAAFAVSLGAWPVVGFMGLDVLAVYVAFKLSYAQALAFERVTVDAADLVVERVDANGQRREWRFPSYWVGVFVEGGENEAQRVTLRSHGRALEIATYLSPFERQDFADALRQALREAKSLPA
jgi:uncharacterized membrane protein